MELQEQNIQQHTPAAMAVTDLPPSTEVASVTHLQPTREVMALAAGTDGFSQPTREKDAAFEWNGALHARRCAVSPIVQATSRTLHNERWPFRAWISPILVARNLQVVCPKLCLGGDRDLALQTLQVGHR